MFLILKAVHVATVIVFLGNITSGFLWASLARRKGEPKALCFTFESLNLADRYITNPAAMAVIVSGIVTALAGRYPIFTTPWIVVSFVLLAITGILFSRKIVPLQRSIVALFYQLDSQADVAAALPPDFDVQYRRWRLWELLALFFAYSAVGLMVIKPVYSFFS